MAVSAIPDTRRPLVGPGVSVRLGDLRPYSLRLELGYQFGKSAAGERYFMVAAVH